MGVGQSQLCYFGVGMFIIVLGFFAIVIPAWAPHFIIMRVHDLFFIIGYAVMMYGAKQMLIAAGLK